MRLTKMMIMIDDNDIYWDINSNKVLAQSREGGGGGEGEGSIGDA